MSKLLLDTHAFLWYDQQPRKLSNAVRHAIRSKNAHIYVSPLSIYELAAKINRGKLPASEVFISSIERRLLEYQFHILPVLVSHALRAAHLDWDHRDPFDRMIAAQALEEQCVLITKDAAFTSLKGLKTMW